MRISVVVPTRDRPASLTRCLAALAAQDAGELELLVLDDGLRRPARNRDVLAAAPEARLIRGPGHGPAAARNLGVRACRGDVVLFCDDDCVPAPGWARTLAQATSRAGAAAGRTIVPPGAAAFIRASQAITNHLRDVSLDHRTGRLCFAPSCNLGVARELARRIPFDETYPLAAGEDRDWCVRATAAGWAPLFEPTALIVHRPELDARSFVSQQFRYGRGAARFRGRRGAGEPPGLRRLPAPSFYAKLVWRASRDGAGVAALVLAAQVVTASGVMVERCAAKRARPAGSGRAQQPGVLVG